MLIQIKILILNSVVDLALVHFFLLQNFHWGKDVVLFKADGSSPMYIYSKKRYILVFGEGSI